MALVLSNYCLLSSSKSTPIQTLTTTHFPNPTKISIAASKIPSKMASGLGDTVSAVNPEKNPVTATSVDEQRVVITNQHGEKLVGILQNPASKDLVILCHGFRSTKETKTISKLADALTLEGVAVFRFDFSGNGESEGTFQYGHYRREAEDLRSVVLHLSEKQYHVRAIAGHSKGGNVVLLYASKYHDIPAVINLSGRFEMGRGIKERLGEDFMERIKENGCIDVKNDEGVCMYRVTEESLRDRLDTDMHKASISIDSNCRVLTVHGSADEIIPVGDAQKFDEVIPNHKLHIVDGADHCYNVHHDELFSAFWEFIKADCKQDA